MMGNAVMCLGSLVVARSTLAVTTVSAAPTRAREGLPPDRSIVPSLEATFAFIDFTSLPEILSLENDI